MLADRVFQLSGTVIYLTGQFTKVERGGGKDESTWRGVTSRYGGEPYSHNIIKHNLSIS